MVNINHIYLLGNLTRDPDLKYTNEGIAIAEMGLAVNRKWRDSDGAENSTVDYFNITTWNNLAENCALSLKKGDRIIAGGHLNLRSWENKEGKKFNIVSITADVVAVSLEFKVRDDISRNSNLNNTKKKRGNKLSSTTGGEQKKSNDTANETLNANSENSHQAFNPSDEDSFVKVEL